MADTKLILGSIAFREFEIPEEIRYGTRHRLEVHKLVGGGRVIDAMGPDPEPIRWRGRFRGPDAASRARDVEALAKSGRRVSLAWGGFSYSVVVDDFSADYQRFYEIPYHISCTVDTGGNAGSAGVTTTLTGVIAADLAIIRDLAGGLL